MQSIRMPKTANQKSQFKPAYVVRLIPKYLTTDYDTNMGFLYRNKNIVTIENAIYTVEYIDIFFFKSYFRERFVTNLHWEIVRSTTAESRK